MANLYRSCPAPAIATAVAGDVTRQYASGLDVEQYLSDNAWSDGPTDGVAYRYSCHVPDVACYQIDVAGHNLDDAFRGIPGLVLLDVVEVTGETFECEFSGEFYPAAA